MSCRVLQPVLCCNCVADCVADPTQSARVCESRNSLRFELAHLAVECEDTLQVAEALLQHVVHLALPQREVVQVHERHGLPGLGVGLGVRAGVRVRVRVRVMAYGWG